MQERRTAPRLRTTINVRWETLRTGGRGTICDLSTSGCFILTGGEVTPPELVRLNIVLPSETATLWGNIVYAINEMGFAVRFVFGAEADKELIQRVIATAH
jgi:PilZ domain